MNSENRIGVFPSIIIGVLIGVMMLMTFNFLSHIMFSYPQMNAVMALLLFAGPYLLFIIAAIALRLSGKCNGLNVITSFVAANFIMPTGEVFVILKMMLDGRYGADGVMRNFTYVMSGLYLFVALAAILHVIFVVLMIVGYVRAARQRRNVSASWDV